MRYLLITCLSFVVMAGQGLPVAAQAEPLEMVECLDEASGCGDVFGDLVHVVRDRATGQPILAQRWVELPADEPGYGWGYCPIAVTSEGAEIGFAAYTCDPAQPVLVQEVDYFGRLNAGRTKERNNRMHFDEVISTLQTADWVTVDETGRLLLGFDCVSVYGGGHYAADQCAAWKVIDSPMESLGLYVRLMKYGHLQTDPKEIDPWVHGDPSDPVQYHPALGPEDWIKFAPEVRHLLPGDGTLDCFPGGGAFVPQCAETELLLDFDLVRAAALLAGAADKTGEITADLVQYVNRILQVPVATEYTQQPKATLGALVRDCWPFPDDPPSPDGDDPHPVDPPYVSPADCALLPADDTLPNFDLFFEVQERFVDFAAVFYERADWQAESVEVIQPMSEVRWSLEPACDIQSWLLRRNGTFYQPGDIRGFVNTTRDWLRVIEFVHNYAVPDDLFAGATFRH